MIETGAVMGAGEAVAAADLKRPRLGFAGLGWIGRDRMAKVAQAGNAEICVLADPSADATLLASEAAPTAARVRALEDLAGFDLDGIVIATPSAFHAGQAMEALRAGQAVFCQKPLARTARETQRVIDAAADANRLLGVDFSYRHTAGMKAIRELIRAGDLGTIYAAELLFHNVYGPDKPWFYDPELSGGGCLIDLGTHLVDLALWCLEFPAVEKVTGRLLAGGRPLTERRAAVEDYAAAQIHLVSGPVIQLASSWRAPDGCDARIEARFFGTRGGAAFRNLDGSFYHFVAEQYLPDRSTVRLSSPPDDWGGRAINEWVDRLARSPEYAPDIERVHQVAAVLDAIYESGS